ncbi:hypothetical protein, unlikely [Trypanosoma brucei gambiense DAL972]|uniref:Uncharacterized protein n=1 Tax=Trypanosoma brucei gambiense (strain MHOM/CI/86/DAL972) TaxID=679716 RepID=C9ZS04_TRYB9|nr:hypothetical protein, unlikely [Trypanosoma brucei gambiense DAL972]CBH12140.1 hypothetical protein, unlikely [Trypanosoma brucei gambiense DAL972]|eukprot:XP_011774423.1 hypothetical protein, unlikely [Trypanosoma brucei gambiense DAL972]
MFYRKKKKTLDTSQEVEPEGKSQQLTYGGKQIKYVISGEIKQLPGHISEVTHHPFALRMTHTPLFFSIFPLSLLPLPLSLTTPRPEEPKCKTTRWEKNVRSPGIEPGPPAWQARILPLDQLRLDRPPLIHTRYRLQRRAVTTKRALQPETTVLLRLDQTPSQANKQRGPRYSPSPATSHYASPAGKNN